MTLSQNKGNIIIIIEKKKTTEELFCLKVMSEHRVSVCVYMKIYEFNFSE